jgi:tetratricopeptide (TPR) repeat protein
VTAPARSRRTWSSDSYNALGDYKKVNEWARRFYANDKLATGKFKDDLAKVIEQSSFKLVSQLEEKKEYAAAAQAYLDFVKDFPRRRSPTRRSTTPPPTSIRRTCWRRTLATRELLFRNYPQSPLVPASQLANAEGYEAIGDFEHAAEAYELYVNGFEKQQGPADKAKKGSSKKKSKHAKAAPEEPKKEGPVWEESKAQIALFNAGVYREGLGQLRQALKDRERYLEIWPAAKDTETVALSIADLHERMNQNGKAVAFLDQRAADQERDPNKFLGAQARILRIEDQKLKNPKAVARRQKTILDYYDKLYRKQKDALEPPRRRRSPAPSTRRTRSSSSTTPAEAPLGQGRRSGEGLPRQHQGQGPVAGRDQPPLHQRGGAGRARAGHLLAPEDRPRLREHGGLGGQRADAPRAPARGAGGAQEPAGAAGPAHPGEGGGSLRRGGRQEPRARHPQRLRDEEPPGAAHHLPAAQYPPLLEEVANPRPGARRPAARPAAAHLGAAGQPRRGAEGHRRRVAAGQAGGEQGDAGARRERTPGRRE